MHVARILLDDRNGPQTIAAKLIRNRKKIYDVEAKIWTAKNNNNVFELNALTSELNALTTNKISLMYEADLLKNSKVEAIEPHTIDPAVSNTAQVSLNDLKRKQQEIQRQIEIETAKLQQTNLSSPALNSNESDFDSINDADKNVSLTFAKHETYKGRLIEFRDFQYKINSVIQTFDTLAQARNYIDGLSSPIVTEKQSSNSIALEKNNTVSIILVLFLSSLLVYGFYYLNKKSQIDSCFNAISNNFHKFNGIDALVNIGMVKEWESECNSMIENLGSVERKLISKSLGNDYMNARNELFSLGWEPIIFNDLNVSARDKFNAKIVNKIFKIKEMNSCYPDDNNTTVICNSLWKKKNELTNIRYEAIFSYDAKSFLVTYAGIEHKASRSD